MTYLDRLDEAVVLAFAHDVVNAAVAWVLIDSPEWVGLAAASETRLDLPPTWRPGWWQLVEDIRVFGPKGEWHAWKSDTARWGHRTWRDTGDCDRPPADSPHVEYHWLWGTQRQGAVLVERGRGFRVPIVGLAGHHDLPLKLKVQYVIGPDKVTGLAAIRDAALRGILSERCVELRPLPPE